MDYCFSFYAPPQQEKKIDIKRTLILISTMASQMELNNNIARLMPWTKKNIAQYIIDPYNKSGFEKRMTFSKPIGEKLATMSNKRLMNIVVSECMGGIGGKEFRKSLVGKPHKEVKEFLWKKIMKQHYHKFPIDELEMNRFQMGGKIFKVNDVLDLYNPTWEQHQMVFITSFNYNKDIFGKSYNAKKLWDYYFSITYENMEEFSSISTYTTKENWKNFVLKFARHIHEHGDYVFELNGERVMSEHKTFHFTDASKTNFIEHYRTSIIIKN